MVFAKRFKGRCVGGTLRATGLQVCIGGRRKESKGPCLCSNCLFKGSSRCGRLMAERGRRVVTNPVVWE